MGVIYRSYNDLYNDIRRWAKHLPEYAAISGVPRSGITPAMMLAFELHVPFIPIECLLHKVPGYRPSCSRKLVKTKGPVLVVDDTCWQGRTFTEVQEVLRGRDVKFAAVYSHDRVASLLDHRGYRITELWHTFEWNLLRDVVAKNVATDLDGVICEDWGKPDDGEWTERYEDWLTKAEPLRLPTWPVRAIVTARLEKYRPQTEAWLQKHGVQYRELIMAPYATARERSLKRGFGHRKAEVYSKLARGPKPAKIFVESEPAQAKLIAESTGLPVISFEENRGYNFDQAEEVFT